MSYFIGSELVPKDILGGMVQAIIQDYNQLGSVSTMPREKKALGYDYGMLLYVSFRLDKRTAKKLFEQTLRIRDDAGWWAEYYVNDCPEKT